jgi:hypothetical protein
VSCYFEAALDQSYIEPRAWDLQELMLPPRTAHFSNGHIYWGCYRAASPPPLGFMTDASSHTSHARRIIDKNADADECWYDLVMDYSNCELTYPKDKLAAISGVSKSNE